MNDPNAPKISSTKHAKSNGGCFSLFFNLMGVVTILISVIGYILSFFDMVIEISGSKLPKITLEIFIPLLVCAAVFLLLGWLIGKLESLIKKKKAQKKGLIGT